jgi:hypothetical protein
MDEVEVVLFDWASVKDFEFALISGIRSDGIFQWFIYNKTN